MKIYLDNTHSENIDYKHIKTNKIKSYLMTCEEKEIIYSTSGIYKLYDNKIFNIQIVDKPSKKISVNGVDFILDDSIVQDSEEYYQIPAVHEYEKRTVMKYHLRVKSPLKLVLEIMDNDIVDMYFETKEKMHTIGIKDDIFTFLSLLKLTNC